VRVLPETKFSYEWEVCRDNEIERYQVMQRGLSKESVKILSGAKAGDALSTELEKELESSMRVKVKRLNNAGL